MTDDTDDLDEFARMFGAKPETPPDGLLPPTEAKPTAPEATPTTPAAPGSDADPLAWLLGGQPAAPTAAYPAAPTGAFPAVPTAAFPAADAYPAVDPFAPPAQPTQVLPTRRSAAAEAAAASPDTGRRNLIILGSIGAVILILIIVLVFVLIARSASNPPTAGASTPTNDSGTPSSTPSTSPSTTPSETPSDTPTPTPTATQAPPPAAPTLSGVAEVSPGPVCGADPTATFSISYSSTHASSISIVSSGADHYSSSATAANGTFTNVIYTCGTAGSQPTETYTVTATGPGGSATFALPVTGSD